MSSTIILPTLRQSSNAALSPVNAPHFSGSTSLDTTHFDRTFSPDAVKTEKSPTARTLNGLRKSLSPAAWTALCALLAVKGAVFLCGVGAVPPLLFGIGQFKKTVKQFKEGYNA